MATPWCRLWADMPNDPKWRTIARVSGQRIGDVISTYLHMLICASNATERGRTQGWNDEDVATALDLDTAQITAIREAMAGRVLDGDYLKGWEKRQAVREDETAAARAKAWREEQKRLKAEAKALAVQNALKTQPNATEKNQTTEVEVDSEVEVDDKQQVPAARAVTSVDLSIAMRAAGMQTQPADPRLIALAEQGVSPETVTAACEEAKASKPKQNIKAGYIFAILERWAADAAALKASGAVAPKSGGNYMTCDRAAQAKCIELGIAGPRPGESMYDVRGRIQAKLNQPDNASKEPPPAPQIVVAPTQAHKSVKPEGLDLKALIAQPKAPA